MTVSIDTESNLRTLSSSRPSLTRSLTVSEANARFARRYGHSVAAGPEAEAGPSPFDVYVAPSKARARQTATSRGETDIWG